jgi:hypothetical protein
MRSMLCVVCYVLYLIMVSIFSSFSSFISPLTLIRSTLSGCQGVSHPEFVPQRDARPREQAREHVQSVDRQLHRSLHARSRGGDGQEHARQANSGQQLLQATKGGL